MDVYDPLIKERPDMKKLGPQEPRIIPGYPDGYPGGCAFKTIKQAELNIEYKKIEGYGVYALEGSWEKDVYKHNVYGNSLNKDLLILERVSPS